MSEDWGEKYWGFLCDKGYVGASKFGRAIHPKKGKYLTRRENKKNIKISKSRVIVENYYGRLKQKWGCIADKWKWDTNIYDEVFEACVYLTNYDISKHPLRDNEKNVYRSILISYKEDQQKNVEKQRSYRKRKKEDRNVRLKQRKARRTNNNERRREENEESSKSNDMESSEEEKRSNDVESSEDDRSNDVDETRQRNRTVDDSVDERPAVDDSVDERPDVDERPAVDDSVDERPAVDDNVDERPAVDDSVDDEESVVYEPFRSEEEYLEAQRNNKLSD